MSHLRGHACGCPGPKGAGSQSACMNGAYLACKLKADEQSGCTGLKAIHLRSLVPIGLKAYVKGQHQKVWLQSPQTWSHVAAVNANFGFFKPGTVCVPAGDTGE
eukprot:362322-Chlamydomonas_euryale.AAC.13